MLGTYLSTLFIKYPIATIWKVNKSHTSFSLIYYKLVPPDYVRVIPVNHTKCLRHERNTHGKSGIIQYKNRHNVYVAKEKIDGTTTYRITSRELSRNRKCKGNLIYRWTHLVFSELIYFNKVCVLVV